MADVVPLNAIFADDIVELLVPVTTTDTMAEVAAKVAHHVEGRRVRARNLPKVVFHDGRELSPELTVAEAGIAPRDHVRVDYQEQDKAKAEAKAGRVAPNRTSGERDATQPQVRDQTEPFLLNVANTVKSRGGGTAGPVLRMSEDIDAVVAAIREDNPGADVEVVDRGAYVRVHAGGKLVVTESTLREHLGPDFEIRSLQGMLSSFAGRIRTFSDRVEWETVSHD